ncbi:MAG: hypothetical protein EPO67_21030 [Reyranella sp.]|jgi:hypothetical protein|nr:MAG: hypothetical protein EPO67_21030 [Reyranella sp.]
MIEQVEWSLLTEHFEAAAVLNKPLRYFEYDRQIRFTMALDGLDYYKAALLAGSKPGWIAVLKQYRGNNPDHTSIYLNPAIGDLSIIHGIVSEVVTGLGLTESDVIWRRDAIDERVVEAARQYYAKPA